MSDGSKYYDEVWEILKRTVVDIKEAGIPDHEMPPAVADFLILSVLAMGMTNGVSLQAAQAIIQRMQNTVEDWKQGNPPFGEVDDPDEIVEQRILDNFMRCMAEFLLCSRIARGDVTEYGGEEMLRHGYEVLAEIIGPIQGNRDSDSTFTTGDQLTILDAVSDWHLAHRDHGDAS